MPKSVVDSRFAPLPPLTNNTLGYGGVATVPNKQNEIMERISRQARRLRGHSNGSFLNSMLLKGRNDAQEQLLVRLGVIPIITQNSPTSLTGNIQAMPSDRNYSASPETITVTGGTAPTVYTAQVGANVPTAVAVAFTAGGNGQPVTAADSVDALAKGRALVDILP